uniref:programmed cell death protein 7 n=1 Tax=Scatophagus argus TaxID=75038 RepID=UPI001ED80FF5|nr:programmed cell death protein 7 [Scatophagus argus]
MKNSYHHAPLDKPPVFKGAYLETPYTPSGTPSASYEPTPLAHTASRRTSSEGCDGHSYEIMSDFPAPSPGGEGFGGPRLVFPYGFDPSVFPLPLGCPPPGQFPTMVHPAPVNTYNNRGASVFQTYIQQLGSGPETTEYEPGSGQKQQQQHEYEVFSESGFPPLCKSPGTTTRGVDETALQRKQDQQWLRLFLEGRDKRISQTQQQHNCIHELRETLYRTTQLIPQLAQSCETLRSFVDQECVWTDSYLNSLNVKQELEDKLAVIDNWCLHSWRGKLSHLAKRRSRRMRARKLLQIGEKQRRAGISEKEAAIDKWRMEQKRQVEEKKKEHELKLAADAVLCEVKKKQADIKRMEDVLKSLEKLRRLRKDAASKKGIVTEQECDNTFSSHLEQLRCMLKRRTAVYSAEEKALMVMLEGELEEERKKDCEKQMKKEWERLLQRKHRVITMLFGDELPADSVLQPFTEFYTWAEHSLHALLQIRREWDMFVAPVDHPESSLVPQSWILPDPPSDQLWASALHTTDSD